jgi:predicted DCC family thiol-disulfide oxidoreductase YuxK
VDRTKAKSKQKKKAALKKRKNAAKVKKRVFLFALAGIALVSVALSFFFQWQQAQRLSDLRVVGQGTPVIVQVHDESCPVCRNLKANVEAALRDFSEQQIIYRVADINDPQGSLFAARHTPERWRTLLFFSPSGELVDVQVGLQSTEELQETFRLHSQGLLSALD